MSSTDVDEYVRTQLPPQHQAIVSVVRDLVAETAPDANEVISRGSPAWKANNILAIISRSKTHITLAFARGAEFEDAHGLDPFGSRAGAAASSAAAPDRVGRDQSGLDRVGQQ